MKKERKKEDLIVFEIELIISCRNWIVKGEWEEKRMREEGIENDGWKKGKKKEWKKKGRR